MIICVKIKTGIANLYNEKCGTAMMKRLGLRPATETEIEKYHELKPLFDTHKIDRIQLWSPENN